MLLWLSKSRPNDGKVEFLNLKNGGILRIWRLGSTGRFSFGRDLDTRAPVAFPNRGTVAGEEGIWT